MYTFNGDTPMSKVNVRQAREKFPELLDRVEHGEEIVVTRRGKEIAKIVPIIQRVHRLPSLKAFRESIAPSGTPAAEILRKERDAE